MAPSKLKQIRNLMRMTQRELGQRLGMTAQQIGNYENGRTSVPRVVELALLYLLSQESYDETVFLNDWNREDMEAYNAL
jgi:transcriptional regulator with XRE-family HTH domain